MKKFSYILTLFIATTIFASQKPTLTIYTYDSFAASWGPAPQIKKIFEKLYHCNLKFVSTDSSIGALRKIQIEGKKTKADILLGLDSSTMYMAKKTNLFIPYHVNTSKLDLPIKWKDNTFLPFDYGYFAFVYNSKKLKNPPKSFNDLLKMGNNFKIIIEDPRSSTPGYGLVLWIKSVFKKKAGKYWRQLSPKILTVTKGWSSAYELFLKGEADMVLSYTTSPVYHIIEEKKYNYKYAYFKKGHYMQIEVAAILKSSKHKKLANKFMQFLLSKTFAKIIPTTNWMYPVVKVKLPKGYNLVKIPKKALLLSSKDAFLNRNKYIREWLDNITKK